MATDNSLTFEITADQAGTIIKLFDPAGLPLPKPEVFEPPVPQQKLDAEGKPVLDKEGNPVFELPPPVKAEPPPVPVWALKDPEGTVKMTVAKDGLSAKFDPTGVLTDAKPAEVSTKLESKGAPPLIGHFFLVIKPGKSFTYVMNKG